MKRSGIIKTTLPVQIKVGQVVITDSEKIEKVFSEFIARSQYNCRDVLNAIKNHEEFKFSDGEDTITVQY